MTEIKAIVAKITMIKTLFRKSTSILCVLALITSGCANTIPSRAKRAVPIHPTALYPVRAAVVAFTDARPEKQKEKAKKISWPKWGGRIDYNGENLTSGLTAHISEYLTASHVFTEAQNMEFLQSDTSLKSLGYRVVITGKISDFNASIEVPKWVLILAVVPNPLFFILPGITLVPLVAWPKKMGFHAKLDDLKLKDLETGQTYTIPDIQIEEDKKRFSHHITAKWYLGELAEKLTKKLIQELQAKDIRF